MANIISCIRIALSAALLFCPALDIPVWLFGWIGVIAVIKLANIAAGYVRQKTFVAVHSVLNKVIGGLLFLFPLTLAWIDLPYSAAIACAVATAAVIHEGYLIRAERAA